jgi:3-mercaptopyruvate sulfurtransferase SseA
MLVDGDWLEKQLHEDVIDQGGFEALLSAQDIANDDTVVLYGGNNNNWFAAYASWYFKLYGHRDVRLFDGGRQRWELDGDGTLLPDDALRTLYSEAGIELDARDTVVYCRIGERSAHTWFVLHELLGQPQVQSYDGSWVEYGSLIGAPIEG